MIGLTGYEMPDELENALVENSKELACEFCGGPDFSMERHGPRLLVVSCLRCEKTWSLDPAER
jgi:hypothetical protein